jgi:hypothetical protein
MASEQMQQLAALFESGRERFSNNNLGLQDVRDICEGLHAASAEPEGVTCAEVDAGGVPAIWCIPAGCDANSVLLHSHAGGSVVFSMHTDRKAEVTWPRRPASAPWCWTSGDHQNTNTPPSTRTWKRHIAGCSPVATGQTTSPSEGTPSVAIWPWVSLLSCGTRARRSLPRFWLSGRSSISS